MPESDAVQEAVRGLTEWEQIARVVEAFGGGWEAVATIGIIAVCVTIIIVSFIRAVTRWTLSKHRTRVQIERIRRRQNRGGHP